MDKAILQITSGKGPTECERAVALALRELMREAHATGFFAEVINSKQGNENSTLVSAIVKIEGNNLQTFVDSWTGVLQWICQSPYRKFHKRKNWFIGINLIDQSRLPQWKESDLEFRTMRSSGPGRTACKQNRICGACLACSERIVHHCQRYQIAIAK